MARQSLLACLSLLMVTSVVYSAVTLRDYALYSSQSTILADRSHFDGQGYIGSSQYVESGNDAILKGSIISKNNVLLKDRTRVEGNITASGNVTIQNQVTVTGTISHHVPVDPVTIPVKTVTPGTESILLANNEIMELSPGVYGALHAYSGAVLKLSHGSYTFASFNLEPDVRVELTVPVGYDLSIDVQGEIRFADRTKIVQTGESHVSDISWYSNYSNTITIGTDCIIDGIVIAPQAEVKMFSRTLFTGAIYARAIRVEPDVYLNGGVNSALGDNDNDFVPLIVENTIGTDSENPDAFPYYAVPDLYYLPQTGTATITYDFSRYYEDYASRCAVPLTITAGSMVNGIVPIMAPRNAPIDTLVPLPAIDTLQVIGRYIEYYGTVVPGKSVPVFVPFPNDVFLVPELVMIGHYVNNAWDIIKPDSVNEEGAYCTVTSFSPFVLLTKATSISAYAGSTIYHSDNLKVKLNIGIGIILNKRVDEGKVTITYNNASGTTKDAEYDFTLIPGFFINFGLFKFQFPSVYYVSDILEEIGPIEITSVSIDWPGPGLYTENCSYTLSPGDYFGITNIKTNAEMLNTEIKGDKLAFYQLNNALSISYNQIAGPSGLEGSIKPVYASDGTVSYSYDYYIKDHLGSTRAVINQNGQLTEAIDYSPYGMQDYLKNVPEGVKETFTGKEFDEEGEGDGIGLYAFPSRMYDPEIGMWISCDPKHQFHSPYVYAGNGFNPINATDPLGEELDYNNYSLDYNFSSSFSLDYDFSNDFYNDYFTYSNYSQPSIWQQAGNAIASFDRAAGEFMWNNFPLAMQAGNTFNEYGGRVLEAIGTASLALMPIANSTPIPHDDAASQLGVGIGRAGSALRNFGAYGDDLVRYSDDAFAGIKQASSFLKSQGFARADRVKILQSFETSTLQLGYAGKSSYGLRYFGGAASRGGAYLFETLPATRMNLALKMDWNEMIGIQQWQIIQGTPMVIGRAASQGLGYPGGQIQAFMLNWQRNLVQP